MFRKVELWFVLLLAILGAFLLIAYGDTLREHYLADREEEELSRVTKAAVFLAEIPSNLKKMTDISNINESYQSIEDERRVQIQAIKKAKSEKIKSSTGYKRGDSRPVTAKEKFKVGPRVDVNTHQKGYVLVSSFDPKHKTSTVKLFDISNNKVIYKWVPDIPKIIEQTTKNYSQINKPSLFRSQHPLLMEDGGIIFSSGEGPLVRLDACNEIAWVTNRHFHHSIEQSKDGSLYVPIVYRMAVDSQMTLFGDNLRKRVEFRDDGFAKVNPETGEILEEFSVTNILLENGYSEIVYQGLSVLKDYIHLNDAERIDYTDDFVQEGDIMLSTRHISMVALYRPSLNKIIWLKIGPWTQPHDIDYLGDGVFTVYGNDSYVGGRFRKYSSLYTYDMKTDSIEQLLELGPFKIKNNAMGRQQFIEDNSIFIDDSQFISIINEKIELSFLLSFKLRKDKVALLNWSRYIPESERTSKIISKLQSLDCEAK